jgi:magnesium-transporting ATPase (P-type)
MGRWMLAAVLCNEAAFEVGVNPEILGDPVDRALLVAAKNAGLDTDRVRSYNPLLNMIPFSSERKMMTTLHQTDGGVVAITKGAPGIVLAHCNYCGDDGLLFPLSDPRCQVRDHPNAEGSMYVLVYYKCWAAKINDRLNKACLSWACYVDRPPVWGS